MRIAGYTAQFKRDYKKAAARGKDMPAIERAMFLLTMEEQLPDSYKDHQLKGRWKTYRELHIGPDWLLVYYLVDDKVVFHRTGTHSDIFNE